MEVEEGTLSLTSRAVRRVCPSLSHTFVHLGEEDPFLKADGAIRLDAEHDGVHLVAEMAIEVSIATTFPTSIPEVRIRDTELARLYPHAESASGLLCLGVNGDLLLRLATATDPYEEFFNAIVRDNLFAMEYYRRYRTMPFEDRSHYDRGVLEHYEDHFSTDCGKAALRLLQLAARDIPYRRGNKCPCGSGMRIKDCHGDIIDELRRFVPREVLATNLIQVADSLGMRSAVIAEETVRMRLHRRRH